MQILYRIIFLLVTLNVYNCQSEPSISPDFSTDIYLTTGDTTKCTSDSDVTNPSTASTAATATGTTTVIVETTDTEGSIGTVTVGINLTTESLENTTTNNETIAPGISTTTTLPASTATTTSALITTSTSTNIVQTTTESKPNLGLILGLSLGLGIPAVTIALIGIVLYLKKAKAASNLMPRSDF